MARRATGHAGHDARAAKPEGHARLAADSAALNGPRSDMLALQHAAGNRAVSQLLGSDASDGQPLDPVTRAAMETHFGQDLGQVRVHTDVAAAASSEAIDAQAYTLGQDVVFGAGQYAPQTGEGQHLLAHELAHVVQQRHTRRTGVQRAAKHSGAHTPQEQEADAAATVKMYELTVDGETQRLTEDQYQVQLARTIRNLGLDFTRIEDTAAGYAANHKDFLDNTHGVFGVVSDIFADTAPPTLGIWSWPRAAIINGRDALNAGKVQVAARQLQLAQQFLRDAIHEWNGYIEKTTGGAQQAITVLEYTRDISFGIAIGTAAIIALPVVAAGAASAAGGVGLTGAAATTATVVGTAGTVTAGGAAGGALLRGGSSAAGQALTGEKVDWGQVKKEAVEGAKKGAVDAGTAVVGAGVGKVLGPASSLGGRIVKTAITQGVAGSSGSALDAALHGKSGREIARAAGIGGVSGLAGGALGGAGTHLVGDASASARALTGVLSSTAGGASGAVLAGGSKEDIKKAIITSALGGLASAAESPHTTESTFREIKQETAGLPEGQGPVTGQKLGAATPDTAAAPAAPAEGQAPARQPPTEAEIAKSRALEAQMAKTRVEEAVAALPDTPGAKPGDRTLKQEVQANQTTMGDGRTTLRDLSANSPELVKELWGEWNAKRAQGDKLSGDFGDYVKVRQREFRGAHGELTEAFTRGQEEIQVKAPKADVTEPGTDMISFNKQADRVKLIDNKAVRAGATVSKVSALEWNLPQNLGDDIAQVSAYASQPGVPPEVGSVVLPRLRAAKADIDAYLAANPSKDLKSVEVQREFARILDEHKIDRVVTTSGGGADARISGKLAGDKGFLKE